MSVCLNPFTTPSSIFLLSSSTNYYYLTSPRLLPTELPFSLLLSVLSSFLLNPFSSTVREAESVITNISVIQTWNWFFALTKFEALFLGLVLAQLCGLQYLGITPININNYFGGDPSGRKRRRKRSSSSFPLLHSHFDHNSTTTTTTLHGNLAEKLLMVLNQVDQEKCALRTLCELQNYNLLQSASGLSGQRNNGLQKLPKSIQLTLYAFSENRRKRRESRAGEARITDLAELDPENHVTASGGGDRNSTSPSPGTVIELYEDAIEYGRLTSQFLVDNNNRSGSGSGSNSTVPNLCIKYYPKCSLTIEEILSYLSQIKFDDIFY